jgi:hypothetical protein
LSRDVFWFLGTCFIVHQCFSGGFSTTNQIWSPATSSALSWDVSQDNCWQWDPKQALMQRTLVGVTHFEKAGPVRLLSGLS